jgi:hypothetical protein
MFVLNLSACKPDSHRSSDPQNTRTDAELLEALKRAWLLPRDGPADPATEAKFSLDASVSDEGDAWFLSLLSVAR